MRRARFAAIAGAGALLLSGAACSGSATDASLGPSTFHVVVTSVNGGKLPTADQPLPANRGDTIDTWEFTVEARAPDGSLEPFDGVVRLSVNPGAILTVEGPDALGRNVVMKGGKAAGSITVTAVYGPTRLWVEDLGYVPAKAGEVPACSNGKNDDGEEDVLIDFPADPGCAFADDDTETGGTYAAGVSGTVEYARPRLSDVQGDGSASPYPFEAIEVATDEPSHLVVTRVSSDGFYVTDIDPLEIAKGYNHIFAFNFSTPPGMRVCDHLTYLTGTANEFFGFTELSFPSYKLDFSLEGDAECEVPEPTLIDAATLADPVAMEKLESSLVRIEGFKVAANFGPDPVPLNVPGTNASSCDLNGDGQVDFASKNEGSCSSVCDASPDCSEWTSFSARGNFKVSSGATVIQIQTGSIPGFDPTAHRGETLKSVTGTLRNFSGGKLNWTIETRCPDDLACDSEGCVPEAMSSKKACVRLRTIDDNDQGTN